MAEKCPACGYPCYIQLMLGGIECSNDQCKHYSEDLYPKAGPPPDQNKIEEDEDPNLVMRYWSIYHTDCGD